jgi:hypothetical protein
MLLVNFPASTVFSRHQGKKKRHPDLVLILIGGVLVLLLGYVSFVLQS